MFLQHIPGRIFVLEKKNVNFKNGHGLRVFFDLNLSLRLLI